jgi:Fe-S cluster assembly iron-binding protein IscA
VLQLTHAAAVELAGTRRAQGLPDTAGIRVFGQPTPQGELTLGVAFVEVPAEDDQITERDGTRLFVAPEVADPLAGAALDVQQTPEGTKLIITEQEPGTGS